MTREEYLLSCLAEECCEVGQRVSKALRFGIKEVQAGQPLNNGERIRAELLDLAAVAQMLTEEGVLAALHPDDVAAADAKRAKVERFMLYSIEQGTLQEQPK